MALHECPCSSDSPAGPLPTSLPCAHPPDHPLVQLLDLHDDALGLIAAHLWAPGGGGGGGFVGACRRTRRVGLAALPSLTIRWCAACCRWPRAPSPPLQPDGPRPLESDSPLRPHPPALDARLPSLIAFLATATGVRKVFIVDAPALPHSDGDGNDPPPPPCSRSDDEREKVWRAVGAALGGIPLVNIGGSGAVASVLIGRQAVDGGRLRTLRLMDVDRHAVLSAAMALQSVASTVTCLSLRLRSDALGALAGLFRSAGRLPAMTNLILARCDQFSSTLFGQDAAAAIASACPGLTSVELQHAPRPGWGVSWALARGALPRLTSLYICPPWDHIIMPAAKDLAAVLTHRSMVSVQVNELSGGVTSIIAALRSVDHLPEVLSINTTMPVTDALRLLDDPIANARVKTLNMCVSGFPALLLLYAAPLPQLHALTLSCTIPQGAVLDVPDVPIAAGWVVPATLRSLMVHVRHEAMPAGVAAEDVVLLRWLLTAVVASRAARWLTHLHLIARIPPGPELDAMLAPLVAASANTLRSVQLGVATIADDGVGKRRRMAAALLAALPHAKVKVFPVHHS